MTDKTTLILPGKKLAMPRTMKRAVQVAFAVGLTAALVLGVVVMSNLLVARGRSADGLEIWLSFIKRTDILATMVLTALVTVCLVYWQRDQERGQLGNRPPNGR
jgi:hypothetical protein